MIWAVLPAAGQGARFGGDTPKQYLSVAGRSLIEHSINALLGHPDVDGVMVALASNDSHWPGWQQKHGKPILVCTGGAGRADSVLAALCALPDTVGEQQWLLVHDAARPCLRTIDLTRLIALGRVDPVGALLATPVRDTLKRADVQLRSSATEPRVALWRAQTPQMFRRAQLTHALEDALRAGLEITDEAMAMERLGLMPRLVEGSEDNIKVTTPADLVLAELILSRNPKV